VLRTDFGGESYDGAIVMTPKCECCGPRTDYGRRTLGWPSLTRFVRVRRKELTTRVRAPGGVLAPWLLWCALTAWAGLPWRGCATLAGSCIWGRRRLAGCGAGRRVFTPGLLWELLSSGRERCRYEGSGRDQPNSAKHFVLLRSCVWPWCSEQTAGARFRSGLHRKSSV
jgi:hypothetical protein